MTQSSQTTNFDKHKYIAVGEDNGYYLVGSKCPQCQKVAFPEKPVCPVCQNYKELETVMIGREGVIKSFTVAHVAPKGFKAPYIIGFIDLLEGPRIFSVIVGGKEEAGSLKKGDRVELVVEETEDAMGSKTLTWKFAPMKTKGGLCHCAK